MTPVLALDGGTVPGQSSAGTRRGSNGSVNAAPPRRAPPGRSHPAGLRARARDPRRRVRGRRRDRGPVGGHRVGPAAPQRGPGRLAAADRRADGAFPDRAVLRRIRQRPGISPAHVRYLRRHFPRPGPAGDLHFQPGHTKTVYYNEVALGRWLERTIRSLGVKTILGTVLLRADVTDARITEIELASRYGNVTIVAHGFVDASGDAALTWQAGLRARHRPGPAARPTGREPRRQTVMRRLRGCRRHRRDGPAHPLR